MSLALDPQIDAVLAPLRQTGFAAPVVGDWRTRRENATRMLAVVASRLVSPANVTRTSFTATASDGDDLPMVWYTADGSTPGSAALYIHGGGMISGSVELYDHWAALYVAGTGVPMLAVDYRLAPEFPHPVPVEDCYAAMTWLAEHADELGVDPARLGIVGDSAGGGLAAGVALLALDRGAPAIALQVLIQPMLDDRNTTPDPLLAPFAVWTYDDNVTGWRALLGDNRPTDHVPAIAAPSRRQDLLGLPPAYLDVGALDIFRDETARYAIAMAAAGVPVEFHLHPGAPHSFATIAPESDVSRRALADRFRVIRDL